MAKGMTAEHQGIWRLGDFTSNVRGLGLRAFIAFISILALPLKSYAVIDPTQLGMDSVANFAVYAGNTLTIGGSPTITGDVSQNIASVSAKVSSVSAYAALQTPTLTLAPISNFATITGNGTYNFISVPSITLTGVRTLTLIGGANDVFVFNVTNVSFAAGAAKTGIVLNGVATNHVLFNLLNPSAAANALSVTSPDITLFGTFIAPNASMSLASDTIFGGLFAGGNNLTLNSGTITANVFALPEPSSFALVGIACLFGLGTWSRRRR